MLFGAVPVMWSTEKCVSWMLKEVSSRREKSGTLRPLRASRLKILPLHLTVEQAEAQRGKRLAQGHPARG